ncbi:MAG: BolA/IbaG family iron-sulfur metabolism protein [Commensalibacter sp.]|nr:BolA/IbaG family iron-sulfur metabolism protein [Commensalibacter sp.]
MTVAEIEAVLKKAFPDAQMDVGPLKDDGRHFYCRIASKAFANHSKVQQHQMVYKALDELIAQGLHALSLQTSVLA